jgi:hypothetical protein
MITILLLAPATWLGVGGHAHAATTVQVVSTHPSGGEVTLGRNQNFYLHLRYQSDQPVRIWARPYFHGKSVQAGSDPSRVYPAGSGEALGWFFLFDPDTRVDEVRITAGDRSARGTPVVAVYPVQVKGGPAPGVAGDAPGWVTRLNALDTAAQKEDYQRRMDTPLSTGDVAMLNGFMVGMLAIGVLGLAAPAWGIWRWRGGWRLAATLPAALMAFVVLRIVVDTARDPTSHDLLPFEILMTGALSAAVMFGLRLARKFARANR